MRNLLAFLLKYKFFFIFLALEIIAFSLIINHTYYQRHVLLNSANRFTGTLYSWNMGMAEYFSLKRTNVILAEENARLREKLPQSLNNDTATAIPAFDSISMLQYSYVPARVVSNSTHKRNNYLMIDKGRRHGIDRDMAVIASNGVVGIVMNVSENYAWVMSALNSHSRISGRLKRSGYNGSLLWEGVDYRTGTFRDVPSHAEIQAGDTVVTSGYSFIFPPDIMIGTVTDHFVARGDHFFTLNLAFSVDFNRLAHVYVVKNLVRKEQMSIIEEL